MDRLKLVAVERADSALAQVYLSRQALTTLSLWVRAGLGQPRYILAHQAAIIPYLVRSLLLVVAVVELGISPVVKMGQMVVPEVVEHLQ